ncbi:ABC transporter ATP-binding protein [Rhodoferax sp.]|uniref:ABC transporter ATP-binding protein n=1 Tax=Rhodoferax sp. TaxID=50421 RepID=UPI0025D3A2A8|nr:ABC transporter ATP-binding protein [Rhodoferax sp.]
MIQVRDLVFDYLGHRALHGVSVDIPAGTVTALVGPNGAGKSTLMRCMAGLDTPLSGSITVGGIDVQEHPREVHTQLGYLSDFFGLYQELTVQQCLSYAAASQGIADKHIAKRVLDVARFLNLSDKLQSLASNLSRGQRQRVAIGQAIVHMPRVLLLDEPASGLDPEARADLSVLFRTLQAKGMTLVVSSHILSELDEYCTHILSIREGRVSRFASLAATATGSEGVVKALLQVQLAAPAPQLAQALAAYEVAHLDASGATPTTVYLPAGDLAARAALLAKLTAAGVPVCAFQEVRTSLQMSYGQADPHHASGAAP